MSWQFWLFVHVAVMLLVVDVALRRHRPWAVALAPVGMVIGGVLAVLPLWLLMNRASATTSADPGNAGIFYCCTVPTLPLNGLFVGFATGSAIDASRAPGPGHCSKCGYDLRGHADASACPECGAAVSLRNRR